MELRHVRYFLAVVECGSISAASRDLHVAQPSLSRQLHRFETDLGVTLFDRSGNRLRLSALGRAFLPLARDLLHTAEMAGAAAKALAAGSGTRLTLAAAPATLADIIAPFIASSGPTGAATNALPVSPDGAYQALREGYADLAISTRIPPSDLHWRLVGHTFPWAQTAPDYPAISSRNVVTVAELLQWPLIVMTRDHAVRSLFDDAVTRAGLAYEPAFETASNSIAQALAAAGRGICILSDHSRFGLTAIPIESVAGEMNIGYYAAWEPHHYAAQCILDTIANLTTFFKVRQQH